MKVAVTGANGFVGQHVMRVLGMTGAEIVAITRTTSPHINQANVEVVSMDIAECGSDPFTRMGRPDTLIHLAWDGLPNYQAEHHLDTELPVQKAFLKACIRSGLKHLIVTGTCLEYGMQTGALNERMPATPTTTYGKAKDSLRRELERLHEQYDFGLTWLRMFYLYGPGQAPTSLYSQLRNAVVSHDPTFAMSPGDQVRDFMPVEDAAGFIAQLALQDIDGGIVNLCSGRPETVINIVRRWLQGWNASLELQLGVYAYPDYEPFTFWGTRTKLDELLGISK